MSEEKAEMEPNLGEPPKTRPAILRKTIHKHHHPYKQDPERSSDERERNSHIIKTIKQTCRKSIGYDYLKKRIKKFRNMKAYQSKGPNDFTKSIYLHSDVMSHNHDVDRLWIDGNSVVTDCRIKLLIMDERNGSSCVLSHCNATEIVFLRDRTSTSTTVVGTTSVVTTTKAGCSIITKRNESSLQTIKEINNVSST